MMMKKLNIYSNIPEKLSDEIVDVIFQSEIIRIERIISDGQASPDNFWYDQEENEWVILLKGKAKIKYQDQSEQNLTEGDYIFIPSHKKHRVEWTDNNTKTVWLAMFFK
jgi:cupin 2 domain-containing protein